jgi:hypothetical protein
MKSLLQKTLLHLPLQPAVYEAPVAGRTTCR